MSRSRNEIISLVLQSAITGASRVKIMYDSYLSYVQVKEYLAMLEKNGLVQHDKKTRHYITTTKGKKILSNRNEIRELGSSISNEMANRNAPILWY